MKPFYFREFTIFKNEFSHKVGTDSMLLGAVVDAPDSKLALDVGSGCGMLSLMLAQKYPQLQIDAIEIDVDAYEEGVYNFNASKYKDRINGIHADLLEFKSTALYDLIVCNPPYYLSQNHSSKKNKIQKHTNAFQLKNWMSTIKGKLSEKGAFWLIYPSENLSLMNQIFLEAQLFESQQIQILSANGLPVRIISKYQKEKCSEPHTYSFGIRDENGAYTEFYKNLSKDFHSKDL